MAARQELALTDPVQQLRQHGDREALVIDDDRLTYAELADRVDALRGQLEDLGIGDGGRIALLMPNSVDMVTSLLAAWAAGAVVVPVNTRYRSHELAFVLAHSEVEVVLTSTASSPDAPDLPARVLEAFPGLVGDGRPSSSLPDAPWLRGLAVVRDARLMPALSAVPPLRPAGRPGHVEAAKQAENADCEQLLIYTSGTTANPKGCVHDVDAFLETARHTAATMGVGEGDVVWDPLPFFHTGGLLPMLGTLQRGATFCSAAHFDAEEALALLERERVTAAYPAFSTLVTALLDAPTFPATDLSALRWILAIGPWRLLQRVQEAIPTARQVSCYGCTEVGGVVVYNDASDRAQDRATTSGRPFPGVAVEIVDPFGEPVGQGSTGEIAVRGPGLLRRYYRDSVDPLDERGRFRTGDLGRVDARGQLVFEGRLKDMLKVGGENVAASEIELVLAQHPAVTLAAVVPVPDDRLVEVPVAFVELRPDHAVDEEELIAFCRSRLASFKVPRQVRFVTSWPMSATKIQKFRLRSLLDEEPAPGLRSLPDSTSQGAAEAGAR